MNTVVRCAHCFSEVGSNHGPNCATGLGGQTVKIIGDPTVVVPPTDGWVASPEAPIWPEHPDYFQCCGNLRTIGHMPNCSLARRYGWKRLGTPPFTDPSTPLRSPDPTNPKDMIGAQKLPLSLVPDTMAVYAAMAFAEGASKYGAYNWRAAGVRFSIYIEALRRHTDRLWNGEWADPISLVPHLSSMLACVAIIADAHLCGKLVDDRPPSVDLGKLIQDNEAVVRHVNELNRDKSPHHWTIGDNIS